MLVKNFLGKKQCEEIAKIMEEDYDERTTKRDPQITDSNTKAFRRKFPVLHYRLIDRVSKIFGKELIPTNDYSRVYAKGAILDSHFDAGHCEYSLTLNIKNEPYDKIWPFYVADPLKNRTVEYLMEPGDAVFYYGMAQRHWREELEFDKCYQVFLHYVDKNGSYAHLGQRY